MSSGSDIPPEWERRAMVQLASADALLRMGTLNPAHQREFRAHLAEADRWIAVGKRAATGAPYGRSIAKRAPDGPASRGASVRALRSLVASSKADNAPPARPAAPSKSESSNGHLTPDATERRAIDDLRRELKTAPHDGALWGDVRRTAWHEAGHAVAFLLEGAGVAGVRVRPYRAASGSLAADRGACYYRRPERASPITALAGQIAEELGCGSLGQFARAGWEQDERTLREVLSRRGESGYAIPEYRRKARKLLTANVEAVRQVAEALCSKLELSGDEAERIITAAVGIRRSA